VKLIKQYDIKVEQWRHDDAEKFMGANRNWFNHSLGITPPDPRNPDFCYFNVWVERTYKNERNGIVFHAKTYSCFLVQHNNRVPSEEFYFDLIEKATCQFGKIFRQRTRQSNLLDQETPDPQIKSLKDDIQNCIDIWDRTVRNTGMN